MAPSLSNQSLYRASFLAPVNMALIKYWGKRNETWLLPCHDSLSVCLSCDDLATWTTAAAQLEWPDGDGEQVLYLNGKKDFIEESDRLTACIQELRQWAEWREQGRLTQELGLKEFQNIEFHFLDCAKDSLSEFPPAPCHWPIRLVSRNNFPTAAGLASSASGFACLVLALARLWRLDSVVPIELLSRVARRGSGSACRSLFGGFVQWKSGLQEMQPESQDEPLFQLWQARKEQGKADSTQAEFQKATEKVQELQEKWLTDQSLTEPPLSHTASFAVPVAVSEALPCFDIFVCVVNAQKKHTSSTAGMRNTVATSRLFMARVRDVVPVHLRLCHQALSTGDWSLLTRIIMADSNSFHSVCLDTQPPIAYMNETSRLIVQLCLVWNSLKEKIMPVAYTFDAGPNAVVLVPRQWRGLWTRFLTLFVGWQGEMTCRDKDFIAGEMQPEIWTKGHESIWEALVLAAERAGLLPVSSPHLPRLIHTQVGDGPRLCQEHLIDANGNLLL